MSYKGWDERLSTSYISLYICTCDVKLEDEGEVLFEYLLNLSVSSHSTSPSTTTIGHASVIYGDTSSCKSHYLSDKLT